MMRIQGPSSTMELLAREVLTDAEGCVGDLHLCVRAESRGFAGGNGEVWIDRPTFDRFVRGLRRLHDRRRGHVEIQCNAGALRLRVEATERRGALRLCGEIGEPRFQRQNDNRISFSFDLDAERLPALAEELEELGGA